MRSPAHDTADITMIMMMIMIMMMKSVNNLTGMLLLEVESVSSGFVEIGGGLLGVRRPSWKEKTFRF